MMEWLMVVRDHSIPTSTGKPLAAYSSSRDVAGWTADRGGAATVGCCAGLRYVRRQTACSIYSAVEVAQDTSGSVVLPSVGAATTEGVVPEQWGEATCWVGPVGYSAVGAEAWPVLEGADEVGSGVTGELVAGPKGSVVNPKGAVQVQDCGIWEL